MVKKAAQATSNRLLRAARKQRGWTQQQVADLIGAPLALNVTRWERGTASPSPFYTQKLCQLFGQTPQELGLLAPEEKTVEEKFASPTYWNVPYRRNPFFLGRETLLLQLSQALLSADDSALPTSCALSGLGGIGKTQLALEYAYHSRTSYLAIFWVRAANRETLIADLSAIASLLDLSQREQGDQRVVIEAVLRWFQHNRGWLLILDNADDLTLIEEFVPRTGQGHVLLTTRTQTMGKLATRIEVEKLAVQESILLLLRRAKLLATSVPLENTSEPLLAQATALALQLDGLPLALDQAAAYIEESGCSLSDYLLLYERHQMEMLKRGSQVLADYPLTVASTWSLSFQQVEQTNPAAADLLRMIAFLHPDAIPESIMTQGESSALLFNEAIGVLRSYSLLKRDAQAHLLNVHRLVQAVLKDMMDAQTRRHWAEYVVQAVSAAFPVPTYQHWTDCELYLPQALVCAELIEQYEFRFPEAARLLDHAGSYLRDRALYGQAKPLLQHALAICEQAPGPEHPQTASTLNNLAQVYYLQGHYDPAEPLLQRALAICEHAQGAEHLDTATILYHLQWLYYLQGKYALAEPLAHRTLAIREKALGPEHPDTSDAFTDLALLYDAQGKYELAEPFLHYVVAITEQSLGLNHPETATVLSNLAYHYDLQGKHKQAEPLYLRALAIYEQAQGPEHPDVARTLNHLGWNYKAQGKYEQAESFYQRALAIRKHALGPDHPDTACSLKKLGELYQAKGEYEQAEPLYQQALAIYEQSLDRHHPHVRQTLNNLASLRSSQGKDEQVKLLDQQA